MLLALGLSVFNSTEILTLTRTGKTEIESELFYKNIRMELMNLLLWTLVITRTEPKSELGFGDIQN